jgi:outer membrane protein assembly factor BamA
MGPLKLSYGKAINPTATDRTKNFDFQIGGGF